MARALQYGAGSLLAPVVMSVPVPNLDVPAPSTLRWSLVLRASRHGGIVRANAVRTGVVAAAGTAFARAVGLKFGYWVPLTAVAVLQPDSHRTWVRAMERAAGTIAGTAVVAVVAALTKSETVLVCLVLVASAGLFALRDRGYHWVVMLLTPTALLMISTVNFQGWDIAVSQIVNTGIGIAVAVMAIVLTGVLGTWMSPRPR